MGRRAFSSWRILPGQFAFSDWAAELLQAVRDLEAEEAEPLKFDCMPDWDNTTLAQLQDQRPWRESVPAKVRVYHAFMRTTAQNMREHKLFMECAEVD